MSLASQFTRRGTRAAQPAANAVVIGTLYFVTDEFLIERSDGTNWQSYSVSGAGDVVGPASATDLAIARFDGASGTLLQDSVILVSDTGALTLPDNIRQTANPGANAAGLNIGAVAAAPDTPVNGDIYYNSSDNKAYVRANGAWVDITAAGASEWTTQVDVNSDQDVENSTTLTDSTDLQITVTAESVWYFRCLIVYSGNNGADDWKWRFTVTAGAMRGSLRYVGLSTANAIQNSAQGVNGVASTTEIAQGVEAGIGNLSSFQVDVNLKFTAGGTFKFQFAQNAAGGAGTFARLKAGSRIDGKRLV